MRNIVLAGFMGVGKTTVGRIVAERLGMTFVETDALIEAADGRTIPQIFAQSGEAAFRELEATICRRVAEGSGQVIALGGGAILNEETRRLLAEGGLLICLTCDLEEIIRRVGGDGSGRPLFRDREAVARLLAGRLPVYNSLPVQMDTTGLTPEQVAEEIVNLWLQHS
ncbi:MAG TPA: shikimate kinase [Chloroflexi bacterium]|nr:shikimate kinase [Chloroflexota bacterium]